MIKQILSHLLQITITLIAAALIIWTFWYQFCYEEPVIEYEIQETKANEPYKFADFSFEKKGYESAIEESWDSETTWIAPNFD